MKSLIKRNILLFIALALGSFLRLYSLSQTPLALTWDEAALGYNAYSLLHTLRDEHGSFLPLIFKSFGDFKPGLYIYLALPSVALLGLGEFAVRLPSALAGILAIYGVYLLAKTIFSPSDKAHKIGSFAALALSLTPLHIHFSRGAWETNVYTTLIVFGLYFLIRSLKQNASLIPPTIIFVATFFTYQGAKLLTPLVIIATLTFYFSLFKSRLLLLKSEPKQIIVLTLASLIVVVLFASTLMGDQGNRLKRLSIFGYRPALSQTEVQIDGGDKLSLSLFHGQAQLTSRLVAGRYLKHFSPGLLFYQGLAPVERGHLPNMGALLPFDFIFLIFGLVYLAKRQPLNLCFILILLFLAPIPGSLTLSDYSTVRSLFMVVPLSILLGSGYTVISQKSKWLFSLFLLTLFGVVLLIDNLLFHANHTYAKEFQYGYKEAVLFSTKYPDSRFVLTDVYGQPYIYYLFYTKFNPKAYQQLSPYNSKGVDVGSVGSVGKAEFHQFGIQELETIPNTVFAGTIGNVPTSYNFPSQYIEDHQDVIAPNGDIILRLIKTKAK